MRSRHAAVVALLIALCAQLVLVLLHLVVPLVLVELGSSSMIVMKALWGVRFVVALGVLGALARLAQGDDSIGKVARVGAIAGAAALIVNVAPLPPSLGLVHAVVACVLPVACWLVLSRMTTERGRTVPVLLTVAFGFGLALKVLGAIATTWCISHSLHDVAIASAAGTLGSLVVPAAVLAIGFPLADD